MENDLLEVLDGNIKSLIDRLGKVEKDSDEYKQSIHEIQEKGGRLKKIASPLQSGIAGVISDALSEKTAELKNVGRNAGLSFETKAAPSDMTSYPTSASVAVGQYNPNIQFPPSRPYHLRELFTTNTLTTLNLAYLKESSYDGNISPTKQGSIKPQLDYNLTESVAPARTIAGFVRIASQLLDDIPNLLSYLSYRLSENLLVAEDNQILNGDGFDPNISGILLAANHTAKTGSATIFLEKLVQAAGQIAAVNRRATGIVVNPTDYYSMLLNTASTSGLYSWPTVMQVTPNGDITILGVRVIWSAAISAGNYLVGDFMSGAGLYFRQQMNVQVFYQDSVNVQQNMVTIRCEERIAMPVYNANAFIYPT